MDLTDKTSNAQKKNEEEGTLVREESKNERRHGMRKKNKRDDLRTNLKPPKTKKKTPARTRFNFDAQNNIVLLNQLLRRLE